MNVWTKLNLLEVGCQHAVTPYG